MKTEIKAVLEARVDEVRPELSMMVLGAGGRS